MSLHPVQIDVLKEKVRRIEAGSRVSRGFLPFGVGEIDGRLPGGGLALGALHEVAGGGNDALYGATAALFAAGVLARTHGPVLWCRTHPDLYPPAIALAGLHPDRVIFADGKDDKGVLACMEEGLRYPGLAGVVGEIDRLAMVPSRRLQLAAETNGTLAFAIRRWRRPAGAADFGQPTASTTRWRVSALSASPLPVPGVGRPRWFVELIRAKAGECAEFEVESCDETGCIAIPAELVHRPASADNGRERAIA